MSATALVNCAGYLPLVNPPHCVPVSPVLPHFSSQLCCTLHYQCTGCHSAVQHLVFSVGQPAITQADTPLSEQCSDLAGRHCTPDAALLRNGWHELALRH